MYFLFKTISGSFERERARQQAEKEEFVNKQESHKKEEVKLSFSEWINLIKNKKVNG